MERPKERKKEHKKKRIKRMRLRHYYNSARIGRRCCAKLVISARALNCHFSIHYIPKTL